MYTFQIMTTFKRNYNFNQVKPVVNDAESIKFNQDNNPVNILITYFLF